MSKDIRNFFGKLRSNFDMATKLSQTHTPGQRIVPSRTARNDADYQLRLVAGEVIAGKQNVVLQVNSQAKGTALQEYLNKHGSHAKLAQAVFDTEAPDLDEETARVLAALERDGKENLK